MCSSTDRDEHPPGQLALPLSVPGPRFDLVNSAAAVPAVTRQKQLGAFYTPPAMAQKLVDWAVRSADDRVLDPSFGGLAFLSAADDRLRRLATEGRDVSSQLYGVDVDEDAHAAIAETTELGLDRAHLLERSFFDLRPSDLPTFEAVVGNPPYVRYQGFNGSSGQAHELAAQAGVRLTRLASSWAPFLIHATSFVAPGGRMAQVLPAEIIHAQYASGVLDFLSRSFERIHLVVFEERVFPGALEEVALLFADGRAERQSASVRLVSYPTLGAFSPETLATGTFNEAPRRLGRRKLVEQLLPPSSRRTYQALTDDNRVVPFGELASVDIGVVTGANDFFMRTREEGEALPPELLKPAVSKANHLQGAQLTDADHAALLADGKKGLIFAATRESSPATLARAQAFLDSGEEARLHQRYKCRVRSPWWALPLPRSGAPELLLTYCSNTHPRLVVNEVGALHTNTLHGVRIADPSVAAALAASFYNSLTLLSAELVGRSYGGGVLKLEPTEAEALLVPLPTPAIEGLLPEVDRLIRAKDLDGALDLVDPVVLGSGLGLAPHQIAALRDGARRLRARRKSRGRAAP
jgi:adenine-specific DNA methylase